MGLWGVPWRLKDYNGAIINIICQDYKKLASYIDIFSPMSYHLYCGKDIEWIGEVTKEIVSLTQKSVWVTIQACSIPVKMTNEEFEKTLREGLADGSSGIRVFSFRYIIEENKWDTFVKTVRSLKSGVN